MQRIRLQIWPEVGGEVLEEVVEHSTVGEGHSGAVACAYRPALGF